MNLCKKLLLALSLLLVLTTSALAAPPELVLVKRHGGNLYIARGNGKTEKISSKGSALSTSKSAEATLEQLHDVFTKLYAEGYVLQNSSTTVSGGTTDETTYVFVKPN